MTADLTALRDRIVYTLHANGGCRDVDGQPPECAVLADRLLGGALRPLLAAREAVRGVAALADELDGETEVRQVEAAIYPPAAAHQRRVVRRIRAVLAAALDGEAGA